MWAPSSIGKRPGSLRFGAGLLACLLAGCAVGPNFVRPEPPAVTHYASGADPTETATAHGAAQRFTAGAAVNADWWRLFDSAKLDAVIAEALAANPGLEAAQASLRQSESNLRAGYGIFYPQAEADAAATRQRFSPLKFGSGTSSSIFNLFTLSASVSYALDVFGGERRMIEGLHAQLDLQRATEQATYLTLISNVVNTVIARAAYRAEIDATDELIELQRQQLKLAGVQVTAGTAPYSNVLSLESQLASTEATVPQLEQRLTQSDDLLATLVGHVPADWSPPDIGLGELTLPAELPVSLPAELVRQRPDVLVAEATAHGASANVGVATAALLPGVTLTGSYSANSTSTGQITAANGRAWDVGAGLTQPLFEGGTLWFRRKAALAQYQQAAALYAQVVLAAFAQVADTLRALEHDAAALRAQDEALAAAKEALHLVQANYEAGLDTYLDVLSADAQYRQALISDLQTVAVRYQDTVALYVALGGGWWTASAGAPPHSSPGAARAYPDALREPSP
ncbi:MAG TPA: efflux transporter outer membrane subunit [Steroidobacteraceae bacterium]|nr:efflux transporter outer membrane subunit [Steroidobacteraceae bacterium]